LANANKKAAQMTAKLRSQEGEVLHSKGGASNTELGIFHSKKNVKQKFATNEKPPHETLQHLRIVVAWETK
jgi:hypothetical protein